MRKCPQIAFRLVDGTPANVDVLLSVVRLVGGVLGGETYAFGTWGPFRDEDVPAPDELADGHVDRLFWLNVFPPAVRPSLPSALLENDDLWLIEELDGGGLLVVTCDDPVQRKNANGVTNEEAMKGLRYFS